VKISKIKLQNKQLDLGKCERWKSSHAKCSKLTAFSGAHKFHLIKPFGALFSQNAL